MFSYENISFVYKVHSPQLNTEQSVVEVPFGNKKIRTCKTFFFVCTRSEVGFFLLVFCEFVMYILGKEGLLCLLLLLKKKSNCYQKHI